VTMNWQHFEGMEQYRDRSPCCGEGVRKTVKHILLGCPKWSQQRQEYMGEILKAAWKMSRSILSHPTNERWGHSWCFQGKIIQLLILGGEVDGSECNLGCRLRMVARVGHFV